MLKTITRLGHFHFLLSDTLGFNCVWGFFLLRSPPVWPVPFPSTPIQSTSASRCYHLPLPPPPFSLMAATYQTEEPFSPHWPRTYTNGLQNPSVLSPGSIGPLVIPLSVRANNSQSHFNTEVARKMEYPSSLLALAKLESMEIQLDILYLLISFKPIRDCIRTAGLTNRGEPFSLVPFPDQNYTHTGCDMFCYGKHPGR